MSIDIDNVKNQLREYIVNTFVPGEDPANLQDEMHLKDSGILDSVSTLKLVSWVEETFSFEVGPREASASFNTIEDIAELIEENAE